MKRQYHIFSILVLLFIASFFLSFFVSLKVALMGLLILFSLTTGDLKQKLLLFKERKYIWFMLAFALILIVSFFLSDNRSDGARFLELRIPLLLFPISVGLVQLKKGQRDRLLLGIAIIVSIACLISLGCAIYYYVLENNPDWLYNDPLSSFIGQQSIYTSLFVNISIYIFAYFIFYSQLSQRYKFLFSIAVIFLFIMNYLLASRNMMIILYGSVILFSFWYILKKRKYLEGITLLMGVFIAGFLSLKFFPKTINRFKELAFTQFDFQSQAKESHYSTKLASDQWNGANFRLAAWQCGWQLFKEHPLTGVGLGDKKDELVKVYEQRQFHFAINTKKNVHNNYLDILFSMGVAGLILFLAGWIVLPFIEIVCNRDGLAFIILVTLTLAILTENYFDRSIGAIAFGFFVPFLLTSSKVRKVIEPTFSTKPQ